VPPLSALEAVLGGTGHASIEVVWRRKQQTQTACVQFVVTRAVSIAITLSRRAATSLRRFVRGSPRGAAIATVSKNPRVCAELVSAFKIVFQVAASRTLRMHQLNEIMPLLFKAAPWQCSRAPNCRTTATSCLLTLLRA
jgi:hypothetical protein